MTHQVVQVGSEKSDSFNPLVQLLGLLCVCYFKSDRGQHTKKTINREAEVRERK